MFTFNCLQTKAFLNFSILVARFNSIFRVESTNAESKPTPSDSSNSLIGNIALIKDMNPKMQVRSKNAGANHQIQGGGLSLLEVLVNLKHNFHDYRYKTSLKYYLSKSLKLPCQIKSKVFGANQGEYLYSCYFFSILGLWRLENDNSILQIL